MWGRQHSFHPITKTVTRPKCPVSDAAVAVPGTVPGTDDGDGSRTSRVPADLLRRTEERADERPDDEFLLHMS